MKRNEKIELPLPNDALLTVQEVARELRVEQSTVRRWIRDGVLEGVSLPHVNERQAYRIRRSELNRVLNTSSLPVSLD